MKKGLIVFIALMLPMSAFGSTELIYTWGYGEVFYEALQALKGFTSEADYLVKMALAIAVFVFSISYSKAGLGFSLNAMMDIPTLRVSEFDRELQINMDYYVRNCFQHNMGTKIPYNSLNKIQTCLMSF